MSLADDRFRGTMELQIRIGVYPKVSAEQLLDHFAVLKGITDRRERRQVVDALL